MKKHKLSKVALVLTLVMLLTSCGGSKNPETTTAADAAITTPVTSATAVETTAETTAETAAETEAEADAEAHAPYKNLLSQNKIDDNYRNFYEIFVRSFADSNGDGVGDINGLISKLDYLNDNDPNTSSDLGIDGIWLMPIHPSTSYHKYDVKDYKAIEGEYGTLDDFKNLIAECDKRGINVIIDAVWNHSSSKHPWFLEAVQALKDGTDSKYIDYYCFSKEKGLPGYKAVPGVPGYYYECVFWEGMPDLNLDNVELRADIADISKYWLDMGVSGFRLDAITSYYAGSVEKNTEFMEWLNKTCKEVDPNCYIVCEGWTDRGAITDYYSSKVDSMFNFPCSQGDGTIVKVIRGEDGSNLASIIASWNKGIKENNPNAIDAPFLSNHDNARIAGTLMGKAEIMKLAANVYQLMPGNSFIYYGEEIAMRGSGRDENKRLPMIWQDGEDETITDPPPNAEYSKFKKPSGVATQQEDATSLLNHYKKLINVKDHFPEIARGTVTPITVENKAITAYISEYDGESCIIVHNMSKTAQTVTIDGAFTEIAADLNTNGVPAALSGKSLTISPKSSVVLD